MCLQLNNVLFVLKKSNHYCLDDTLQKGVVTKGSTNNL